MAGLPLSVSEPPAGDEAVVFKYLARSRIAQRDPRVQPDESVLCGGKLVRTLHTAAVTTPCLAASCAIRRPVCHFAQVHPPYYLAALGH